MSASTATATRPSRTTVRAPERAPRRTAATSAVLALVPVRRRRASSGTFVAVVIGALALGLAVLLGLNTVLAQGSFTTHDLESELQTLQNRRAALQEENAALASPQRLAEQARGLGMVPSDNPAFIRTTDGAVLGVPKAGVAPPKPKPKPKPSPTAPAATTATSPAPTATAAG